VRSFIAGVVVVGLATLPGCAGIVAGLAGSGGVAAAKTAAASAMASGAAPAALGVGVGVGVAAGPLSGGDASERTMVGMSRANAETCAGFHGRTSETLPDGKERWTYQRNTCRLSISFTQGYVTDVSSDGSSDCSGLLRQCQARAQ
jgi:hypothetical protein